MSTLATGMRLQPSQQRKWPMEVRQVTQEAVPSIGSSKSWTISWKVSWQVVTSGRSGKWLVSFVVVVPRVVNTRGTLIMPSKPSPKTLRDKHSNRATRHYPELRKIRIRSVFLRN